MLLYRWNKSSLDVLLGHPGGPYFKNRDGGAWSIPKGLVYDGEKIFDAAKREFYEEVGFLPDGPFIKLSPIKQKKGKIVYCWACEGDFDLSKFKSQNFSLEWPPKSGEFQDFPELDKVEYFDLKSAMSKLIIHQRPFIEDLAKALGRN